MYQLIHYYKFFPINDLHSFWSQHKSRCTALRLKGRIYIAPEGINGSVCGTPKQIAAYQTFLRSCDGFADTEFKEETCDTVPFYQLRVKIRPEIVSLKKSFFQMGPQQETGTFLEPREWRRAMESERNYLLLDVRNQYESTVGHFEGAMIPPVTHFFNFPQWLEQSNLDRNQKVLMYCTGGIRCEKFSSLMKQKGFKNVYQLKGGIINYAQKENGAHFKGKCFVFDDRMTIPVNPKETEPIARCAISGVPCDTYINCANVVCNRLFICSKEAAVAMEGCCSEACRVSPNKRPIQFDQTFVPFRKLSHDNG